MQKYLEAFSGLGVMGLFVLMCAAARSLLIERYHGWVGFFSNLFAACVAALFVYYGSEHYAVSESLRVVLVGAAAFLAPDLLLWVRATFISVGPDMTERVRSVIKGKTGE